MNATDCPGTNMWMVPAEAAIPPGLCQLSGQATQQQQTRRHLNGGQVQEGMC